MEKELNYIVWIGGVFDDESVLSNIAISPAGNKWQLNFINALKNDGHEVINVGHVPERVFPYGRMYVSNSGTKTPEGIRLISSSYLNVPFIRMIHLNILYSFKLLILFRNANKKPDYVISYNTYFFSVLPLLYLKYVKRIKWISLIADPMNNRTKKINPFNSLCDGKVFLSWDLFIKSKTKNKFHLDGGISRIVRFKPEILKNKEKYILYTGAIARHTGIELLINAFNLIKNEDLKLIICGKGHNEFLMESLKENKNISFLGMVNEDKLTKLYSDAYMFINPRLITEETNHSNFPSKILEYLAFCKPIISTYTKGISPDYNGVIKFVKSEDPQEMADRIDEIDSLTESEYTRISEDIISFIENKKKWTNILKFFIKWVKEI